MQANRGADTRPELAIRSMLHAAGLRYRVNFAPIQGLRCRPDVVFTRAKVAVFVDGCFWHACPTHGTRPKTNQTYWDDKIARNVARDRRNDAAFAEAGWRVIRVWEHESADDGARAIINAIRCAPG
jgi:DNA mismatch endonuclease (patch repair protein)